jgi:hypothetical protein
MIALSLIVLLRVNLTLGHMTTIRSPFRSRLSTYNFSLTLTVFRRFFTWIALGDVNLCLTLILVPTVNAVIQENS